MPQNSAVAQHEREGDPYDITAAAAAAETAILEASARDRRKSLAPVEEDSNKPQDSSQTQSQGQSGLGAAATEGNQGTPKQHGKEDDPDLYDITAAATAAETAILEASARDRKRSVAPVE